MKLNHYTDSQKKYLNEKGFSHEIWQFKKI